MRSPSYATGIGDARMMSFEQRAEVERRVFLARIEPDGDRRARLAPIPGSVTGGLGHRASRHCVLVCSV